MRLDTAHAAQGMGFDDMGLSQPMLAAVARLGFAEPTSVQRQAIPAVLAGSDVLAAAQTGTGKTIAFLVPALDGLAHAQAAKSPRMLVVTPTRELAQQILEVALVLCASTHHRATAVVGGVGYEPQRQALLEGFDVLVATPGRLLDLVAQDAVNLDEVRVLVIDEADRMLDMGFLPDTQRIADLVPATRQTLLFSATLEKGVEQRMASLVRDPVRVEIAPVGATAHSVEQYVLGVSPEAKKRVLVEVLRREGAKRVIAFVRGRHRADHLGRILQKKGFSCLSIHGGRSQRHRSRALARFVEGQVDVLVATDVLARGIDVADVAYVVNVDVPDAPESYVHRIGRTGRAGETGWALTLCSEAELPALRAIERLTGREIPVYPCAEGLDVGVDGLARV